MPKTKHSFTKDEKTLLKQSFLELAAVCNPNGCVFPEITMDNVANLADYERFKLENGTPVDMNAWDFDDDWRQDHGIQTIKTPKTEWYYNFHSFPCLFSADGQKRATFNLMDGPAEFDVLTIPGVKQSLKSALRKFDDNAQPSDSDIASSFAQTVLDRIFNKKFPKERICVSLIKMVEHLRQSLNERLSHDCIDEISKTTDFQNFISSAKPELLQALGNDLSKQISVFLESPQYRMKTFELGEKFGYIKNAKKMKKFQQVRDYERHKKERKPIAWTPTEVYRDFKTALGFSDKGNPNDPVELSERNLKIRDSMDKIVDVFDRLEKRSQLPKPTKMNNYGQPRKDNKYWKKVIQDLLNQGQITEDLAWAFHFARSDADKIAHTRNDLTDSQKRLDDSNFVVDEWLESFILEDMKEQLSMMKTLKNASDSFIKKQQADIEFRSLLISDRNNLPLGDFVHQTTAPNNNQTNQR